MLTFAIDLIRLAQTYVHEALLDIYYDNGGCLPKDQEQDALETLGRGFEFSFCGTLIASYQDTDISILPVLRNQNR